MTRHSVAAVTLVFLLVVLLVCRLVSLLFLSRASRMLRDPGSGADADLQSYQISVMDMVINVEDFIPATAGSFSALEDANHVECLFSRQSIDRYRASWAQANHSNTFDGHTGRKIVHCSRHCGEFLEVLAV